MSNVDGWGAYDTPTPAEQQADRTHPPEVYGNETAGPWIYRVAHDEHGLAGVLYAAVAPGPGRGQLLLARRPEGPSEALQRVYGPVLLSLVATDSAREWMDDLPDEWEGIELDPSASTDQLDELRRLLGLNVAKQG